MRNSNPLASQPIPHSPEGTISKMFSFLNSTLVLLLFGVSFLTIMSYSPTIGKEKQLFCNQSTIAHLYTFFSFLPDIQCLYKLFSQLNHVVSSDNISYLHSFCIHRISFLFFKFLLFPIFLSLTLHQNFISVVQICFLYLAVDIVLFHPFEGISHGVFQ